MDPIIGGALIGGASKLLGGLFGGGSAGGIKDQTHDAAFGTIRGKVEAAKKFGISPLYALGAPTSSWSGSVGGEPTLGSALSEMGQDVGRAVAAKQTDVERAIQQLTLDKAGLENEYLRAQIASVRNRTLRESAPAIPDSSLPIPGNSGMLKVRLPGLGEKAEKHYSDIGGNIFGGAALAADVAEDADAWFQRVFGFNPKAYSPWAVGGRLGRAFRGPRTPHSGAGESW